MNLFPTFESRLTCAFVFVDFIGAYPAVLARVRVALVYILTAKVSRVTGSAVAVKASWVVHTNPITADTFVLTLVNVNLKMGKLVD